MDKPRIITTMYKKDKLESNAFSLLDKSTNSEESTINSLLKPLKDRLIEIILLKDEILEIIPKN